MGIAAHEGEMCREMPLRSKPEGWSPAVPGSRTTKIPLLSMLVLLRVSRCRENPGQAADDAVTLLFLKNATDAAFPKKQAERSAPANRLIDETANPDVHHQANRQKNKQCSRAAVAH